ncbi:MAG: hypothetical protein COA73_14395 [Candidatus Hydrogenedentota bacterium]|nr:MAG: hypothetical protein COA73_16285 [Candidatus Hydrogenedentota bacterium]PCJ54347.1 MAG: hypothetical protein COA73_14395 [Candidatus Hydrogenedentota bacterium]
MVKHDGMEMGRHDDEGVDAQVFVVMAMSQAVGDYGAGSFGYKNGTPIGDGTGYEVNGCAVGDSEGFHRCIMV